MFSIVDILNHENITWTLMVGRDVCITGGTQFVCVRLFCPFSDFLKAFLLKKPTESRKVESILFFPAFITRTMFFLHDTFSSIIQLVGFVASIEYF